MIHDGANGFGLDRGPANRDNDRTDADTNTPFGLDL
jgi:hypothetical protein